MGKSDSAFYNASKLAEATAQSSIQVFHPMHADRRCSIALKDALSYAGVIACDIGVTPVTDDQIMSPAETLNPPRSTAVPFSPGSPAGMWHQGHAQDLPAMLNTPQAIRSRHLLPSQPDITCTLCLASRWCLNALTHPTVARTILKKRRSHHAQATTFFAYMTYALIHSGKACSTDEVLQATFWGIVQAPLTYAQHELP